MLFIQIGIFFIFVIENINNLNNISFTLNLSDVFTNGTNYTFNVNFLHVMGILLTITGIVSIASLNILDIGLNEEGTRTIANYVYYFLVYSLLTFPNIYYLEVLGKVGVYIIALFGVIWLLRGLEIANSEDN